MKLFYVILLLTVMFSCKTKEEKQRENLTKQISNESDSLLIFSTKMTEEFLVSNRNTDCFERKNNYKLIQKTYNKVALKYKQNAILLNLPEDTVRYRLGLSNKVLQNKSMAKCVGIGEGYDQFQFFLTQLKLQQ